VGGNNPKGDRLRSLREKSTSLLGTCANPKKGRKKLAMGWDGPKNSNLKKDAVKRSWTAENARSKTAKRSGKKKTKK